MGAASASARGPERIIQDALFEFPAGEAEPLACDEIADELERSGAYDELVARLQFIAEFRAGLASGQVRVFYQPIVDLVSGAIVALEALARFEHPTRGLLAAAEFIGEVEAHGLCPELTACVVAQVERDVERLRAAGLGWSVAVNVSGSCLAGGASDAALRRIVALGGAVSVELTEAVFADSEAIAALRALEAAGVSCAIDDFGTGYSCLATLKCVPASVVKIDRAFVRDIERDGRDLVLVQAIASMAKALGLRVVAEGIETPGAARLLRAAGFDYGQGYHFAPALPLECLLERPSEVVAF